jgi:hypothetical protein
MLTQSAGKPVELDANVATAVLSSLQETNRLQQQLEQASVNKETVKAQATMPRLTHVLLECLDCLCSLRSSSA